MRKMDQKLRKNVFKKSENQPIILKKIIENVKIRQKWISDAEN